MIAINCCDEVCFSELVSCFEENGYKKAWGWTTSTGQSGRFVYTPPIPWEYDPMYSDKPGGLGTHGGCLDCIMTLVHLRKPIEKDNTVLYLLTGVVVFYFLWKMLK